MTEENTNEQGHTEAEKGVSEKIKVRVLRRGSLSTPAIIFAEVIGILRHHKIDETHVCEIIKVATNRPGDISFHGIKYDAVAFWRVKLYSKISDDASIPVFDSGNILYKHEAVKMVHAWAESNTAIGMETRDYIDHQGPDIDGSLKIDSKEMLFDEEHDNLESIKNGESDIDGEDSSDDIPANQ
jgi:hypothetical protein